MLFRSQSSMQQDAPPDSQGEAGQAKDTTEGTQEDGEVLGSQNQSIPCSLLPRSPKPAPPTSPLPKAAAPGCPPPTRPPLKPDGLRQNSVIPKTALVRPRVPQRSCSSVDTVAKSETATPPSPKSISNGYVVGVESGSKTAQCQ